ncbi:E3 ubiquitin/ISG15 ligase TRIM25-like [Paramisgurnus dabryanus]|uniref:E3 ubiquitin/ISG15 ligase TRIM25-like n=1 Tax=Paramisgurnus dabryanus TaxID=90735 RepID=UPI0031F3451C
MAEASISVSQDQFSCSICLDLLKDPVTINCGHSYCMSCITDCWDQDDQKRNYSCPQCGQTFTTRPVLGKNTMLAEVVEKLKKTKLQAARPDHCYAEPGDVECDVCTERKHKAVKSCLVCLNSYCQNHLEQHENLFKDKKHNLVDATGRLQQMICPQHEKPLEIYCRTDQLCICYLCMTGKHKNHDTISAEEERTEKQKELKETQGKYQKIILEIQKKLQELRDAVETHKRSAQTAVDDTERIFTQLIRSIERRRSEVTQLIRDQEKAAVSEAEGLLKRLEQEIDDLMRRDAELEQLSHTDDHIHFLQSFQSLSVPPGSTDSFNITVSSLLSYDDVGKSLSHLREKLEDSCREEIEKISDRVKRIMIFPVAEPKTREEFLQYSHQLTLDSNTINKLLCLSEGNRVVTNTGTVQPYPDHPDRFDGCPQVLCSESVSGRCYWEVELSGWVGLSVSYKSINRKGEGNKCWFGYNDQSWCLYFPDSGFAFYHNNNRTEIPVESKSSRIGVYVDHSAGSLSFYSVSDTMTLIHKVQTTFTQPLYPGFYIYKSSSRVNVL